MHIFALAFTAFLLLREVSATGNGGVLDCCNCNLKMNCTTNCFVNIGAVMSHRAFFRALQKLEIPLNWCESYSRKCVRCEGCNFSLQMIWPGSLTFSVVITLLYNNSAFCLEPHEKRFDCIKF